MGIKRFVLDLASMAARYDAIADIFRFAIRINRFVNELHASGLSVARHAGIKV